MCVVKATAICLLWPFLFNLYKKYIFIFLNYIDYSKYICYNEANGNRYIKNYIRRTRTMKKLVSLTLSVLMVLTAAGMVQAGAAEVATSFKDDTGFHFSFENESDFAHPDMQLDSIGLSQFKTPGVTRYCEGAYGSKARWPWLLKPLPETEMLTTACRALKCSPGKSMT